MFSKYKSYMSSHFNNNNGVNINTDSNLVLNNKSLNKSTIYKTIIAGIASILFSGIFYFSYKFYKKFFSDLLFKQINLDLDSNFSFKISKYIVQFKEYLIKYDLIQKIGLNEDSKTIKYPYEIVVLTILIINELSDEMYYKENYVIENQRIEILKEILKDEGNDFSVYQKEVFQFIKNKSKYVDKSWDIFKNKYSFINKDTIYNQLDTMNINLLNELIKELYIYDSPECFFINDERNENSSKNIEAKIEFINDDNSLKYFVEENKYYNILKEKIQNNDSFDEIFFQYGNLIYGMNQLIEQKKKEEKICEEFVEIRSIAIKNKRNFNNLTSDDNNLDLKLKVKELKNKDDKIEKDKYNIIYKEFKVKKWKLNYSQKTSNQLQFNQVYIEDQIKALFGIRIYHLHYLIKSNDLFKKNVKYMMLFEKLEGKDRIITFY